MTSLANPTDILYCLDLEPNDTTGCVRNDIPFAPRDEAEEVVYERGLDFYAIVVNYAIEGTWH